MDNVTHALAGLALAEGAVQLRRGRGGEPSPAFRATAAAAGAVAANLPDADLAYTAFAGGKLEYLLHHRGHTHTVVAAVAGAALAWAAAVALWRLRARRAAAGGRGLTAIAPPDAPDRRWLFGLVLAAVLSHLALDWTNDYGVHPFWPADARWLYGDRVFIVEPWLWVAAVPPLLFAARRRAARAALGLVLAAGLALAWAVPLVGRGAAAALTAGAVAALVVTRRLGPGARAAFALGGWLVVELAFAAGAGRARRLVGEAAGAAAAREAVSAAGGPGTRVADVVLTPAPANPLCAAAIVVEAAGGGGGVYRLTTASVSAVPGLVPAERCAARAVGASGPPMPPSPRPSTAAVRWDRAWEAPIAELTALARDNCQVAAFLRFARTPFWLDAGPDSVRVGDLRYARGPDLGFADVVIARRPGRCPAGVPPWRPPRADLLGG